MNHEPIYPLKLFCVMMWFVYGIGQKSPKGAASRIGVPLGDMADNRGIVADK